LKCMQQMRSGCTPWNYWFKPNPLVADEQNNAIHNCGESTYADSGCCDSGIVPN